MSLCSMCGVELSDTQVMALPHDAITHGCNEAQLRAHLAKRGHSYISESSVVDTFSRLDIHNAGLQHTLTTVGRNVLCGMTSTIVVLDAGRTALRKLLEENNPVARNAVVQTALGLDGTARATIESLALLHEDLRERRAVVWEFVGPTFARLHTELQALQQSHARADELAGKVHP